MRCYFCKANARADRSRVPHGGIGKCLLQPVITLAQYHHLPATPNPLSHDLRHQVPPLPLGQASDDAKHQGIRARLQPELNL